jgi:pilus assembly protein CpaE
VPSSRDVPVSVNRGVPIVLDNPGHAVSSAIRELANSHISVDVEEPSRGLRGLISRRARR